MPVILREDQKALLVRRDDHYLPVRAGGTRTQVPDLETEQGQNGNQRRSWRPDPGPGWSEHQDCALSQDNFRVDRPRGGGSIEI